MRRAILDFDEGGEVVGVSVVCNNELDERFVQEVVKRWTEGRRKPVTVMAAFAWLTQFQIREKRLLKRCDNHGSRLAQHRGSLQREKGN